MLTAVALAAAVLGFPLPPEHKGPAPASERKVSVPLGFARVERFYRGELGDKPDVTLTLERGDDGARRLVVRSRRKGETWAKAVITEAEGRCIVEVIAPAVVKGDVTVVTGTAPRPMDPLWLNPRDPAIAAMANGIDHSDPRDK